MMATLTLYCSALLPLGSGVLVVLGTDKTGWLRRFAFGIVCGFAGAIVLYSAEKNLGIGPSTDQQEIVKQQEQIDKEVKDMLEESVDITKHPETAEIDFQRFQQALIKRLSILSASTSHDLNREGYLKAVEIVSAIAEEGNFYPDAALDVLNQIKFYQPSISKALSSVLDQHIACLKKLTALLPPKASASPKQIGGETSGIQSASPLPERYAQLFQPFTQQSPNSKRQYDNVMCATPSRYGDDDVAYPLAKEMEISFISLSRANAIAPLQIAISGYSRLANREANSGEWVDFLFDFADGSDIASILDKLSPTQTRDIASALKGRDLVAKTDVSLRQTFPVVAKEGLIFSRQGGIIYQGDKVRVAEIQVFTTERNKFSQIWIGVISEK
jgi:hypothetical protein